MPSTADFARVGALLDRDRAWAAYAIADLAPEFSPDCSWHVSADRSSALVLLYRGFSPPILFATGDSAQLPPLFNEIDAPVVSLHLRRDAIGALVPVYRPSHLQPMWRMAVEAASFIPAQGPPVLALNDTDLDAVLRLYDDGEAQAERPAFFSPSMLAQGTFRGIREGADLIAVAGTHVFSARLGVCAIGNVYTRRDRRGRGLAARATSAVVEHAIASGVGTIVLNVSQENDRARRVYERLGFGVHCEFFEGEANRTC